MRPSEQDIWRWLGHVEDPEIPVLSVVDLGIVREVSWSNDSDTAECVVTITPTYSGCPATDVIAGVSGGQDPRLFGGEDAVLGLSW